MAFTLIEAAQARWRAVNAPHPVALVRASTQFVNGLLVERPDDQSSPSAAKTILIHSLDISSPRGGDHDSLRALLDASGVVAVRTWT